MPLFPLELVFWIVAIQKVANAFITQLPITRANKHSSLLSLPEQTTCISCRSETYLCHSATDEILNETCISSEAANITTLATFLVNNLFRPPAVIDASLELLSKRNDTQNNEQLLVRLERLVHAKHFRKLVWNDVVEIYVLGTSHVSQDSAADVQALLHHVEPHTIMVELCWDRYVDMLSEPNENATGAKRNRFTELRQTAREWKTSSLPIMLGLVMTKLQADIQEEADVLGVNTGAEFRVAHDYWELRHRKHPTQGSKLRGHVPRMVLGDRPFMITVLRAWKSCKWKLVRKGLSPLFPVVSGLVFGLAAGLVEGILAALVVTICLLDFSDIEDDNVTDVAKVLETDAVARAMASLRRDFPELHETLIEERDAWMAAKTIQACHGLAEEWDINEEMFRLVTIVGAGHVPGMSQRLMQYSNEGTSPTDVLEPLIQCEGSSKVLEQQDKENLIHCINHVRLNLDAAQA